MKKILIVEDELSIANFIADVMHLLGYETKILTTGKKVVSVAKEWGPDLITLDIMMPPPDGIKVLHQLKGDPETRDIPVFIVSVVAQRPDFSKDLSNAQGIFSKPLNIKHFISEIRRVCELPGKA